MRILLDTSERVLEIDGRRIGLYSDMAFEILSDIWVKVGWNQKYVYTFSWLGVPLIQLPEDVIRYQEAVFALRPDVIIETGIAHGGSAIFSASLLKLIGRGRVIAVDIEIRPSCREKIEAHVLHPLITMIEGSSTATDVVDAVKMQLSPGDRVLVVLDSNHSYAHVMAELEAYAPLVTLGLYIIATDGIMRDLADVPRGKRQWAWDNPAHAAAAFVARNPAFVIETPAWQFNESNLSRNISHWPNAWLRRVK
jgi:cephalosporin hydroxylase